MRKNEQLQQQNDTLKEEKVKLEKKLNQDLENVRQIQSFESLLRKRVVDDLNTPTIT